MAKNSSLMKWVLIGAVGIGAWFVLGKPTSLDALKNNVSNLLHGGSSQAMVAGNPGFAGGWVGSVGNPGFHHGIDRPGIPGVGWGNQGHHGWGFGHGGWGGHPGWLGGIRGWPGYGIGPGTPYDPYLFGTAPFYPWYGGYPAYPYPGFRHHGGYRRPWGHGFRHHW